MIVKGYLPGLCGHVPGCAGAADVHHPGEGEVAGHSGRAGADEKEHDDRKGIQRGGRHDDPGEDPPDLAVEDGVGIQRVKSLLKY